jgi:hypothetical protein
MRTCGWKSTHASVIIAIVAALWIFLEDDLVERLARPRIPHASLGALRTRPIGLDRPPFEERDCGKSAHDASIPIATRKSGTPARRAHPRCWRLATGAGITFLCCGSILCCAAQRMQGGARRARQCRQLCRLPGLHRQREEQKADGLESAHDTPGTATRFCSGRTSTPKNTHDRTRCERGPVWEKDRHTRTRRPQERHQ